MKKLISIVTTLFLSLGCMVALAACKDKGKTSDEEIASSAISQIKKHYIGSDGSETAKDYQVLGQVLVNQKPYEVVWTTDTPYAVVGEMNQTDKQVNIAITRTAEDVAYKLTATVTVNKAVKSQSFNYTIPAALSGDNIYNLSTLEMGSSAINGDEVVSFLNGVAGNDDILSAATTSVYKGNNNDSGPHAGEGGFYKLGTSKAEGKLVLTFSKKVSKVTIQAQAWASGDALKVNDCEAQAMSNTAEGVFTFELAEASTEITIVTANRGLIFEIAITYAAGVHNHVYTYTHIADTWTHSKTCTAAGCDLEGAVTEDCNPLENVCRYCENEYTEAQIIEALFALTSTTEQESLPGSYKLTGVIDDIENIDPVQNGVQYYNTTFWMQVGGQRVEAYRATGEGYQNIKVGDTVTVVGSLINYKGTHEFTQGCVITSIVPGSGDVEVHQHAWEYTYDTTTGWKHTKVCNVEGCPTNGAPQTENCKSTEENKCEGCEHEFSVEDIIARLKSNQAMSGVYTLTGVVTSEKVNVGKSGDFQFHMDVTVGEEVVVDMYVYYANPGSYTEADVVKGKIVTVTGPLTLYNGTLEFNSGSQIKDVREAGANEKIAQARNELKLSENEYNEIGEYDLPQTHANGATYTWSVKDSTQNYVTITADNKLSVDNLPVDEEQTVTLLVTVSMEGGASLTKEIDITILPSGTEIENPYGTLEKPLTVAEALEFTKSLANGAYSDEVAFVSGYLVDLGTWSSQYNNWTGVYIADTYKDYQSSMQLYGLKPDTTFIKDQSNLVLGAKVTFNGYLQNRNGNTPQMTYKGTVYPAAVAYEEAEDEAKVYFALQTLVSKLPNVTEAKDVTLPVSTVEGVTFTWTSDSDTYTISEDGTKLVVANLPTDEDKTVTLTATANCGSVEENNTKTVTVIIKKTTGGETEKSYYVKVTSVDALVSGGTYLIVYETGNIAFDGSRTSLDAVSNSKAVTISNGKIEATDEMLTFAFTLTGSGSSYSIRSASNKYLHQASDANGLTSNATEVFNTISFEANGDVNIKSSGGAYLRYNATSDQTRFRYYKSATYTSQKAIQLYMLAD